MFNFGMINSFYTVYPIFRASNLFTPPKCLSQEEGHSPEIFVEKIEM